MSLEKRTMGNHSHDGISAKPDRSLSAVVNGQLVEDVLKDTLPEDQVKKIGTLTRVGLSIWRLFRQR